jgi:hypothetical protein
MRLKAHEARPLILRGEAPDGLEVEGSLFIRFFNEKAPTNAEGALPLALPKNLTVHGGLDLWGCKSLHRLPSGMTIEGTLDLAYCTALTSIPADLKVGFLILTGCTGIHDLPEGLTVSERIELAGSQIRSLPARLSHAEILWSRESISADDLRAKRP